MFKLYSDYIDYITLELNYAPKTVKTYKYSLKKFINEVETVTYESVSAYFRERSVEIKPTSLNTEKSMIRAFLYYCKKYRKTNLDIEPELIRNGKTDEPETKFFTPEEVQKIISLLPNEQDKLIIVTMYETGMRIAELVNLKVEDIRGNVIQVKGKGGKRRPVFITEELASNLQNHLARKRIVTGTVFPHETPKATAKKLSYSPHGLRTRLQRQLSKHGVEFRPHMLRHSNATALLSSGADIRSVQKLLGHARIDTTMRYTHVTDRMLEDTHKKYLPQITYQLAEAY